MRKKVIISAVCVLCAILIGVGIYLVVRENADDKITFTINDTLPEGKGKRARVILLAGQSNAAGCSYDEYLKKNVPAEQYATYEQGFDNVYINYFVSGSVESQGFVKCGARQGEAGNRFGPELGLAEMLSKSYSDTFFIIKYTWSGTNLHEQWRSPSSDGETGDLYKGFSAYVSASLEYLESKGYSVEVEAMCWMQGEADACSLEAANAYRENLSNFITDVREEVSDYAVEEGIVFVDAYIAANPEYWQYFEIVNEKKQEVAELSERNVVIDTIVHQLTCSEEPEGEPDLAHYDSLSELRLGHLFGDQLARFL